MGEREIPRTSHERLRGRQLRGLVRDGIQTELQICVSIGKGLGTRTIAAFGISTKPGQAASNEDRECIGEATDAQDHA